MPQNETRQPSRRSTPVPRAAGPGVDAGEPDRHGRHCRGRWTVSGTNPDRSGGDLVTPAAGSRPASRVAGTVARRRGVGTPSGLTAAGASMHANQLRHPPESSAHSSSGGDLPPARASRSGVHAFPLAFRGRRSWTVPSSRSRRSRSPFRRRRFWSPGNRATSASSERRYLQVVAGLAVGRCARLPPPSSSLEHEHHAENMLRPQKRALRSHWPDRVRPPPRCG